MENTHMKKQFHVLNGYVAEFQIVHSAWVEPESWEKRRDVDDKFVSVPAATWTVPVVGMNVELVRDEYRKEYNDATSFVFLGANGFTFQVHDVALRRAFTREDFENVGIWYTNDAFTYIPREVREGSLPAGMVEFFEEKLGDKYVSEVHADLRVVRLVGGAA